MLELTLSFMTASISKNVTNNIIRCVVGTAAIAKALYINRMHGIHILGE